MTSSHASSRLLLIADSRPGTPESPGAPVRRYRIARLHLDPRGAQRAAGSKSAKRA